MTNQSNVVDKYNFNRQSLKSFDNIDNVKNSQKTYQINVKNFIDDDENYEQKQNSYYENDES